MIGSKEDLKKVPIDRLVTFYRKFYQPDSAVLTVSGKMDAAKTSQYVAATVGRITRPARKLKITSTVKPAQNSERPVAMRRVRAACRRRW